MLNIADTLYRWCREARPFALATVIQVSGSAPLPPGNAYRPRPVSSLPLM